jgi:hypothetical protein
MISMTMNPQVFLGIFHNVVSAHGEGLMSVMLSSTLFGLPLAASSIYAKGDGDDDDDDAGNDEDDDYDFKPGIDDNGDDDDSGCSYSPTGERSPSPTGDDDDDDGGGDGGDGGDGGGGGDDGGDDDDDGGYYGDE